MPTVHLLLQANALGLSLYTYRLSGACPTQMSTPPALHPRCNHSHSQNQGPRPPTHAPKSRPPTFFPGFSRVSIPFFLLSPRSPHPTSTSIKGPRISSHGHLHTRFPAASCLRCSPREPVWASLPTTLGSFCLRSGIRGNFMLMRLKRPQSRCGAFFLPRESSLEGGGA